MGLEAVAARQLEVDLVLEEHGRLPEELGHGAAQLVTVAQGGKAGMERAEILDPLEHALSGTQQARLEVHHLSTGNLGETLQLIGPRRDPLHLPRVEQAGYHHEAVALELLDR